MMQRTMKRLAALLLLGVTLAFGAATAANQVAQQPGVMQIANPGGGNGTGGGG
jgi:hypothetical protein